MYKFENTKLTTTERFFHAWEWLRTHEYFQYSKYETVFPTCLDIEVVKVNPENDTIDDVISKNTKVVVWIEAGDAVFDDRGRYTGETSHDFNLDSGGDTFEEAIIDLAINMKSNY